MRAVPSSIKISVSSMLASSHQACASVSMTAASEAVSMRVFVIRICGVPSSLWEGLPKFSLS